MAETAVTFEGFADLRARIDSVVVGCWPSIAGEWQAATARGARASAPHRSGHGQRSIHAAGIFPKRADVRGAYYLLFVDKGTRAHDILPRQWSGSGRGGGTGRRALKFSWGGQTIYRRWADKPAQPRRPFLSRAAHDAVRPGMMSGEVERLWDRPNRKSRYRVARA